MDRKRRKFFRIIHIKIIILFLVSFFNVKAQKSSFGIVDDSTINPNVNNLLDLFTHRLIFFDNTHQIDFWDVGIALFNIKTDRSKDTETIVPGKFHNSILPGVGYSLQTGFSLVVQDLSGFYTCKCKDENLSTIELSYNYTQFNQTLIPVQFSLWTNENKYNITTDWRYLVFPQYTYGLGSSSSIYNAYFISYSNIRLYTTLYKSIIPDLFLGLGFSNDKVWDVHELSPPKGITNFKVYGGPSSSTSAGPTLNFLYDTRRNSINPKDASVINITYRSCFTWFGSDVIWQSLIMDLRKYITFPAHTANTLAFWSYEWLTVGGNPPYVLLPNIGGDPYGNTGRGYIEGRFRGKNMLYAETEYRFGILRNGFLGGVLFANAASFSEPTNNSFYRITPATGMGLRIKFNKFSNTNLALDYGFGADGSHGVFANLGEVF